MTRLGYSLNNPYCATCMGPVRRCTCGVHGTPRLPGRDPGGRLTAQLEAQPPPASDQPFTFEAIDDYRQETDQ